MIPSPMSPLLYLIAQSLPHTDRVCSRDQCPTWVLTYKLSYVAFDLRDNGSYVPMTKRLLGWEGNIYSRVEDSYIALLRSTY